MSSADLLVENPITSSNLNKVDELLAAQRKEFLLKRRNDIKIEQDFENKTMQTFFDMQSVQLDSVKAGLLEQATNFGLEELKQKYADLLQSMLSHYKIKNDRSQISNLNLFKSSLANLNDYLNSQRLMTSNVEEMKIDYAKSLESFHKDCNLQTANNLLEETEETKNFLLEEKQTLKLTAEGYYETTFQQVVKLLADYSKNVEHKQKEYEDLKKRTNELDLSIKETNVRLLRLGIQIKDENKNIEERRDSVTSLEFLLKKDKQILTDKYLSIKKENNSALDQERIRFAKLSLSTQSALQEIRDLKTSLSKIATRRCSKKLLAESNLLELKKTKQNLIKQNAALFLNFKLRLEESHLADDQTIKADLLSVNYK